MDSALIIGDLKRSCYLGLYHDVELLLNSGVDVNYNENEALCWACMGGCVEVVKLLLERGADINCRDGEILYWVRNESFDGEFELVKLLLDAGADVHTKNDVALCTACNYGKVEIVKLLLEAGADIHANDDKAIFGASRYKHVEIVIMLLRAGASPSAIDWFSLNNNRTFTGLDLSKASTQDVIEYIVSNAVADELMHDSINEIKEKE